MIAGSDLTELLEREFLKFSNRTSITLLAESTGTFLRGIQKRPGFRVIVEGADSRNISIISMKYNRPPTTDAKTSRLSA